MIAGITSVFRTAYLAGETQLKMMVDKVSNSRDFTHRGRVLNYYISTTELFTHSRAINGGAVIPATITRPRPRNIISM